MGLFLLTVALFAGVMLIMGVGLIVSSRCLRGSCGGAVTRANGEPIGCEACPRRERRPSVQQSVG